MTGQASAHANRPELVAVHGYDPKDAMHALRLGLQGIELLTTGRTTLPVPNRAAATCARSAAGNARWRRCARYRGRGGSAHRVWAYREDLHIAFSGSLVSAVSSPGDLARCRRRVQVCSRGTRTA